MRVNILFFMPTKNDTLENLTWKPNMEVDGRGFSFSVGWFVASIIFGGVFNCRLCSLASWWLAGPHFLLAKNPHHLETFRCERMSRQKQLANYICIWCKGVHTDMIYTDHDIYRSWCFLFIWVWPPPSNTGHNYSILQEETPLISDYTPKNERMSPKERPFQNGNDRRPRFFRSQLRASFPFSGGYTVARIFAPSVFFVCFCNGKSPNLTSRWLTLPETNTAHLKMDAWKIPSFPFGPSAAFSGSKW